MRANPIYRVASRLATPPGLPTENDTVLVIATGTGAFTGKEGQLANYRFGAWRFVTPERGAIVWSDADAAAYQWDGSTYTATGGGGGVTDPELLAIAALTSAADKGIQFTGSGTAGMFDLTAAAKTVLDDATVAAMVDTLGGASSSGTGGLVRATSPTLVTPALGTPSALNLANATGLPAAGVTGTALVRGNNLSDVSVAATARSNLGLGSFILHAIVPWHHRGDAAMTLTDMAAGDAFLGKSNGNVQQFDATHYTHMRQTCRVTANGTAGTKVVAKYRTVAGGYSATISDYVAIGTSAIDLPLDAAGVIATAWVALASGAKADILLCPVQTGGDGATDPQIRLLSWEFKRE